MVPPPSSLVRTITVAAADATFKDNLFGRSAARHVSCRDVGTAPITSPGGPAAFPPGPSAGITAALMRLPPGSRWA